MGGRATSVVARYQEQDVCREADAFPDAPITRRQQGSAGERRGTNPQRPIRFYQYQSPAQTDVEEGEEDRALLAWPGRRSARRSGPRTDTFFEEDPDDEEEGVQEEPLQSQRRRGPDHHAFRRTTVPSAPQRAAAATTLRTRGAVAAPVSRKQEAKRIHWLLVLGAGMLLMILLAMGLFTLYVWGFDLHNDWTYGTTRTVHLDAVAGDHDSPEHPSHFIGMNIRGQIEIIEFPGGDAKHAKVFLGPRLLWPHAEKAVVMMQVQDVNHDGHLDLLVNVTGEPEFFASMPTVTYALLSTKDGLKQQAMGGVRCCSVY